MAISYKTQRTGSLNGCSTQVHQHCCPRNKDFGFTPSQLNMDSKHQVWDHLSTFLLIALQPLAMK
jgi:hypothetical protein